MDNQAQNITIQEWEEIMQVPEVSFAWVRHDDIENAEEFSRKVYGAKFHFTGDEPRYQGDMYLLHSSRLGEAPFVIIRNKKSVDAIHPIGTLECVEFV